MSEPGGDPSSGISSGDALILPERHPACRRREARPGFRTERENLRFVTSNDVKGQAASGSNREGESTEARCRGGAARSSDEGPVMGLERRGCVVRPWSLAATLPEGELLTVQQAAANRHLDHPPLAQ